MNLIAGQKYLRGADGFVVPHSAELEKASNWDVFIATSADAGTMEQAPTIRVGRTRLTPPTKAAPVDVEAALEDDLSVE